MDEDQEEERNKICTQMLPGLDPDLISYIAGILGDDSGDDSVEEMAETISGLLESAEYCDSAEEAMSKSRELLERFNYGKNNSGNSGANTATATATTSIQNITKQVAATTLKEVTKVLAPASTVTASPSSNNEKEDTISARDARKAKAKKKRGNKSKRSNKLTKAEQARAQALEIDKELHEARIASILSRTKLGSYKGALDAKEFTLPNPGGGIPLLEDATCTLVQGRKYGLIGRNGTGKSTLLRAFAARRVGNIPPNVTVHYVSQEVNLTSKQANETPVEIVVQADLERTLLLDELEIIESYIKSDTLDAEGSKRHEQILSRLEDLGSDSASRRATSLLDNLGFSDELKSRPLSQLSGGWRVRTMLAAAIFAKPDLLLLDEPTNHLSILAVLWLARELSTSDTWKDRIVVVVSHDRHFMDEVCTDCLHVSGAAKSLTQAHGNYSKWAKQRKEQQILFAKEQASRQAEIDKLREYAGHGFKYGGSASQINKMGMKKKQADKLDEANKEHAIELAALQEDIELPINIASGGEQDGFIVQLLNVGFGYPNTDKLLFRNCEFGITSKSRIVLLGENGNGKTTLVKLIKGELQPVEGAVRRSPHARFAKVDQHHADQIDLSMTPLQFLQSQYPGDGSNDHLIKLRSHLASCGVTSESKSSGQNNNGKQKMLDMQNTPASALSGGQRSRVALASVSFARPHVLLLDEPTNNLDLESVAALAESVQNFKGAVICVSHDQFFVQAVANEAWVVNGGFVKQVASFESYRNRQLKVLSKLTK